MLVDLSGPIIDTNVYLSQWPFRRLPGDEPQVLLAKLRRSNVTQVWAGSFDALLHRDLAAVNTRLATDCRRIAPELLKPIGSVNPKLPDWQEDLRRCHEDHRMQGIRLHPGFHGYTLADPALAELLTAATRRRMFVQLAVLMEDERTQHPVVRVPPVTLNALPDLVRRVPGLRLQLLNHYRLDPALLQSLVSAGEVYFDFAMIEGVHGLANFINMATAGRVVFGSYFPFYYWEAAALKMREAALLQDLEEAIARGNAKKFFGDPR